MIEFPLLSHISEHKEPAFSGKLFGVFLLGFATTRAIFLANDRCLIVRLLIVIKLFQ